MGVLSSRRSGQHQYLNPLSSLHDPKTLANQRFLQSQEIVGLSAMAHILQILAACLIPFAYPFLYFVVRCSNKECGRLYFGWFQFTCPTCKRDRLSGWGPMAQASFGILFLFYMGIGALAYLRLTHGL